MAALQATLGLAPAGATTTMPSHAVVWDDRGQPFDIHGSGDDNSCARAINGAGLVVGEGAHGGNNRAWVW